MKRPVLEVIRFDEADIVITSEMGFTAANFCNDIREDGTFTFFGGSGTVTAVTTGADDNAIVSAFKSYFDGDWGSTEDIWVFGNYWGSQLEGMIRRDRSDTKPEISDYRYYNGTYYYRDDGFFWRSN